MTVAALKRERGWTDGLIRKYLGQPDLVEPNPWYRNAAKIRYYRLERVVAAESASECANELAQAALKREARRIAARKAVETRVARFCEEVRNWRVKVQRRNLGRIEGAALSEFEDRRTIRGEYSELGDADTEFVERIMVNYIRHNLVEVDDESYDEALELIEGRAGRSAAYDAFFGSVMSAIAETYPELAHECRRQCESKGVTADVESRQER